MGLDDEPKCPHCSRRMVPLGPYPLACASLKCAHDRLEKLGLENHRLKRELARGKLLAACMFSGPPPPGGETINVSMEELGALVSGDIVRIKNLIPRDVPGEEGKNLGSPLRQQEGGETGAPRPEAGSSDLAVGGNEVDDQPDQGDR